MPERAIYLDLRRKPKSGRACTNGTAGAGRPYDFLQEERVWDASC
jgi:hypothetical protein